MQEQVDKLSSSIWSPRIAAALPWDCSVDSGCRVARPSIRMTSRLTSAGAVQEQKDKVVVTIEDYLWFWLHIIQPEESLAPSRFTNFTLKELQVNCLQALLLL